MSRCGRADDPCTLSFGDRLAVRAARRLRALPFPGVARNQRPRWIRQLHGVRREQRLEALPVDERVVERRVAAGLDPAIGSVASLFVSRWDKAVADTAPASWRNRLGIAVAQQTYTAYRELLDSDRAQRLADESQQRATMAADEARKRADEARERGRLALEEQKSRLQDAIDAGKQAAAQRKDELMNRYESEKQQSG